MNLLNAVCVSVIAMTAAGAAYADPINYPNFTGATGLTFNNSANGTAGITGASATLTTVGNNTSGGAVYASNALSQPSNFSTTFSFNVTSQSTGLAGNGFAFVLSSAPSTMGLVNQNLGLGVYNAVSSPASLDIQFSTFANQTNNPTFAPGSPYSNLVAVSTKGPRVLEVHVAPALLDYVQALIAHTRSAPGLSIGLSPRAAIGLLRAARAWALIDGRQAVIPEHVQAVFAAVVEHRIRRREDGLAAATRMLGAVPIP